MYKQICVSIVRHFISVLIGWLVSKGAVTGVEGEFLAIGISVFLVNVAWSVTAHLLKRWHIRLALLLPKGADIEKMKDEAAQVSGIAKFKQAWKEETKLDRAA